MNYKTKKAISISLGVLSSMGTIATAILVAKETPKAYSKVKELKAKKDTKKIEYIKQLAPIYYPAALVCGATIASNIVSNVISIKTEASLIAASTMITRGWNKYKDKVRDIFGEEGHNKIESAMSVDDYESLSNTEKKSACGTDELFWEEHIGFFKCNPLALTAALSDLNQRLHTPDPDPDGTYYWTTLWKLILDADAYLYDSSKKEMLKTLGWTTDYLCECYDIKCMWVHTSYSQIINPEDGVVLYTKIDFHEDPIYLIEGERTRHNYKSRVEYEHPLDEEPWQIDGFREYCSHGHNETEEEFTQKINDIQQEFIKHKVDCSSYPDEDDGRRFLSSNPLHTTRVKFANGRDVDHPESEELKDDILPSLDEIPEL